MRDAMKDCPPFKIASDRALSKAGDVCIVAMDPAPATGCRFDVTLDGKRVEPGDDVGDFHVVNIEGKGSATFRAINDKPGGGIVEFILKCETCGPTPSRNNVSLGTGGIVGLEAIKTVGLVVTVPIIGVSLIGWGICELICLLLRLFGANRDCEYIKKFLNWMYGMLPDWILSK